MSGKSPRRREQKATGEARRAARNAERSRRFANLELPERDTPTRARSPFWKTVLHFIFGRRPA